MTTFNELINIVNNNVGNRSDAFTLEIVKASINYSTLLAAVLFRPPELFRSSSFNYPGGSEYVDVSSYDDIMKLFNTTRNRPIHPIPHELVDNLIPDSLTYFKYYSLLGNKLYAYKSPDTLTTLKVSYFSFPVLLNELNDVLEFTNYDSYIISISTAIAFASLEEGDSATIWQNVAGAVTQPLSLTTQARETIQSRGIYLQTVISGGGNK